ncbi:hypothetical protein FE410_05440 [Leuconostoc carnosum]|uniref:hypothetical protein n=1 Tax=Leuconostoc carnosum TaxID=1252 RepID=UPI00123C754B|nr:hypothetical protein [Leuconostoc carnosum]KAA8371134.1 hypothetical protein FE414_05435 [Leuconostoc carnosum]KAA8382775.1 hypothetical protein FE410_05440 [Leuconostoc carnosum]
MDKKTIGVIIIFVVLMIGIFNMGGNNNTTATDKTSSSSTDNNSDSSSSSSSTENQSSLDAINDWYKNHYANEQTEEYSKDNKEYFGTRFYRMGLVFKGFKTENNELTAIINNNQLKAEGFTQKQIANYAFNMVLTDYKGKVPNNKNIEPDGRVADDVLVHPEYYSTLE